MGKRAQQVFKALRVTLGNKAFKVPKVFQGLTARRANKAFKARRVNLGLMARQPLFTRVTTGVKTTY